MKNYIALIICIIITVLSLRTIQLLPLDTGRLIIPGIAFSIFVLFIQIKNLTIGKACYFFLLLMLGYGLNIVIGFSSWGLATPIAGGLGGGLIKIISDYDSKIIDKAFKNYILLGFSSSAFGLAFYFSAASHIGDGLGFAGIIGLWQITIGLEYILQVKYKRSILN